MGMRKIMRETKNTILNYSEGERLVREATSNDAWQKEETMHRVLLRLPKEYRATSAMLWSRLTDFEHLNHVSKSLSLISFLVMHSDNDRFVTDIKAKADVLLLLKRYRYMKDNRDMGGEVRRLAADLYLLLFGDGRPDTPEPVPEETVEVDVVPVKKVKSQKSRKRAPKSAKPVPRLKAEKEVQERVQLENDLFNGSSEEELDFFAEYSNKQTLQRSQSAGQGSNSCPPNQIQRSRSEWDAQNNGNVFDTLESDYRSQRGEQTMVPYSTGPYPGQQPQSFQHPQPYQQQQYVPHSYEQQPYQQHYYSQNQYHQQPLSNYQYSSPQPMFYQTPYLAQSPATRPPGAPFIGADRCIPAPPADRFGARRSLDELTELSIAKAKRKAELQRSESLRSVPVKATTPRSSRMKSIPEIPGRFPEPESSKPEVPAFDFGFAPAVISAEAVNNAKSGLKSSHSYSSGKITQQEQEPANMEEARQLFEKRLMEDRERQAHAHRYSGIGDDFILMSGLQPRTITNPSHYS